MSEPGDPLVRLLREALRFPSRLAVAILSVIGLGLSQLYLTWLVKRWVEGPLMTGEAAALRQLMMQAGAVTLGTMLFLFLSRTVITGINQRVIERIRNTAVERIFASEVASVRRHPSGELLSRLFNDVGVLSTFFSTILRRFIRETIVAAGAILMMFVLHWRLALATFALVPVTGFLLVKIGAVIRRWGSVAQVWADGQCRGQCIAAPQWLSREDWAHRGRVLQSRATPPEARPGTQTEPRAGGHDHLGHPRPQNA